MRHHRLGLGALGVAAALLASTGALAGYRHVQRVVISDVEPLANGDLGQVANTEDTTQYIGCYTLNGAGACNARNEAGVVRSCSTSDPSMLAVMRSLRGDSYLIFRWDTNGHCTSIHVDNTSDNPPKKN